jgi:hypothetical protein
LGPLGKQNIFREGAGQVFADLPAGLICRTASRWFVIARRCKSESEIRRPATSSSRPPRNDEEKYAPRNGTDCFRRRKNGKCADTEGASTAGISFLLALLLGGAAFLFTEAAAGNAVGTGPAMAPV